VWLLASLVLLLLTLKKNQMTKYKNGDKVIVCEKSCIYVGIDPTSKDDNLWHIVMDGQCIFQVRDRDVSLKPFTHGELIMHGQYECYYIGKHPKHEDLSVVVMKDTNTASNVKTMLLKFIK